MPGQPLTVIDASAQVTGIPWVSVKLLLQTGRAPLGLPPMSGQTWAMQTLVQKYAINNKVLFFSSIAP
jgi:hypothetical protein